jgi:aryl-alcohol dehydrogenase-like predicted oxidoreductase
MYREVSDEEVTATLGAAWSLGVRAFDTAPKYGEGLSERRVGRFLSGLPRRDFVLSTKVGLIPTWPSLEEGADQSEASGEATVQLTYDYSESGVRRSLEQSLERLGLERVDVVLVHDPQDHMTEALEHAFPALIKLREEGVVSAVGAGMNYCEPLERIVDEVDVDCVLVAGQLNLLDQQAARSLLPACAARDVAVLVGSVFATDVLVNPVAGAHYGYGVAADEVLTRARKIGEVCRRHEVSLGAAAIHLPLRYPAVTAVVVGARTPHEVTEDIRYLATSVPDELYAELAGTGLIGAP